VRRIAAGDFRVRQPLADTYRALILGPAMSDAAIDAFLARLTRAGADDLRLGALVFTGRVASQLAEYRRLATASGDPWFAAIAEQETAAAEMARGDFAAAERRLRTAITVAQRERLAYRVLLLRDKLVQLHKAVHQLAQAAEEARVEYHEAIAAGEGVIEMNTLTELAALNQDRYANELTGAYLAEQLERTQTTDATGPSPLDEDHACATRQYAYQSLAILAVDAADPDRARALLARAITCSNDSGTKLMLQRALVAAEIYRLGHRDRDAELARKSLAALRFAALSPAEQAMIELIEGDLVLDVERGASERHLRDAITRADHHTDDANLNAKARAYGFSLLALSAGHVGDFARVIDLLAEALEVERPARCAMAIARYDERVVVAFADARGETGGQYMANRSPADPDVRALVPAPVVERLRACDRVSVLARAPVLGAGRLLPPDLAWSYRLTGSTSSGARPAATEAHRLAVANPEVPSDLKLPPLGPYPEEPGSADVVLRGADATPTRVLLAMRNASVIEFHTHGFIGNDVSETSYLVLSPELDRQYALTAADVAQVKLDAAPLVILGACYAASSSRSLEGGMGLAEAFLRSGARAVVASPDAIPDLDAPAFFAAIREQITRGVDPAIALRNERVRRLATSHDDAWVSGVVVFE
ncbi:MAG TPA: CHAT domain-containing protein, partial [Kofleriaceae bacterium]|nr:CHAT domain-containing protein [Kofleriaceae bacterium]